MGHPMTHPDARIRTYRPTPPLLVWRIRRRWDTARWAWVCRMCGASSNGAESQRWPHIIAWREALSYALEHLHTAHGCPSMLASGEPCDEYCADCGGKGWIK